jgi:hypothetical protein
MFFRFGSLAAGTERTSCYLAFHVIEVNIRYAVATAFFRPIRLCSGQAAAGRQKSLLSFVLAPEPPEQTKKTVISLLPQAKSLCGSQHQRQLRKTHRCKAFAVAIARSRFAGFAIRRWDKSRI